MKYFFLAGEPSGDLHGSLLAPSILEVDPHAELHGWGGHLMMNAGIQIYKDISELSFMGFAEVIQNIFTIHRNFQQIKRDLLRIKPDVVIMIDYPGFNLRMAKWCKHHHIKVAYYISPQLWAWKENRIHTIKKYVDEMLCILPFEKKWYADRGYKAHYIGHPLVKYIEGRKKDLTCDGSIAVLPGSRVQELQKKMPILIQVFRSLPERKFVIAQPAHLEDHQYPIHDCTNVTLVKGDAHFVLSKAELAIVTSGTATLETALMCIPQIVIYKANWLSYQIAKRLVKVSYISLVNLIADREIVKELIQDKCTASNILHEIEKINKEKIKQEYKAMHSQLQLNDPTMSAARIIYSLAL
jgi:lipid-A-disaccharide synthase